MFRRMTALAVLTVLFPVLLQAQNLSGDEISGVHDVTMADIDGVDRPLSAYKGKVLLLVNTASKCGYTPQYESLEVLYQRYRDKGFAILAFPANNFGEQEPGSDEEIKEFCSTNYGISFDLFSKVSVKGDDIHPLFAWLTQKAGHDGEIRWNFEKFLVDVDGKLVARFGTRVDPMDDELREAVELQLLGE